MDMWANVHLLIWEWLRIKRANIFKFNIKTLNETLTNFPFVWLLWFVKSFRGLFFRKKVLFIVHFFSMRKNIRFLFSSIFKFLRFFSFFICSVLEHWFKYNFSSEYWKTEFICSFCSNFSPYALTYMQFIVINFIFRWLQAMQPSL